MSAKEKKWRKFYKVLFILFYGLGFPFSLILYFTGKDAFPYALLTVAVFLPTIRYNHLKTIKVNDQSM
ncbi:hypothetical protein [Fictibacillus sp. 18YEL24]|uniref:hypothetical protein n=1 Tax=Fictibacillus sp. 18YEL24 TaxID=2745875 RepID=UPI0018CD3573|nr:hypothetical protein [Fictibacillus sp. 18YEL24]MBH0171683.1 hypothetical protein [Fictibacillus sp. 18YEL24]